MLKRALVQLLHGQMYLDIDKKRIKDRKGKFQKFLNTYKKTNMAHIKCFPPCVNP